MKKKKKIILLSITIILIAIFIISKVDSSNKIFKDGVLFAITLDGKSIEYFPERGKYGVSINCKNGLGRWLVDDWKFVVENIKGDILCNLDFVSSPDTLIDVVQNEAQTNENDYRYSGSNPNNYLWFNNEMWRIIGNIPVKKENGITESLVKIIRNDSIGNLVYDAKSSDYTSAWGNNTLYNLLNDYYYGQKDGTVTDYCYFYGNTKKSKCDYSTIGVSPSSNYGSMVENVYWNTGGIAGWSATGGESYISETSIQDVLGYVGLIAFSDFKYSSSGNSFVPANSWITGKATEWTLTAHTSYNANVWYVDLQGILGSVNTGLNSAEVRPVVYLDPSVYVVSGNGTEANPYQIAM